MIGAGVLADDEDRIGLFEILQDNGALADADRFFQRDAAGLVAHVRAVGEVVGAVEADEQLVEVGRLVGGAAGGVELGAVGAVEAFQDSADRSEGVVPRRLHVSVGGGVVAQRVRQAALTFQVVVAPAAKFADGVALEELGAHALVGRFPGDGLHAVLAEFEG